MQNAAQPINGTDVAIIPVKENKKPSPVELFVRSATNVEFAFVPAALWAITQADNGNYGPVYQLHAFLSGKKFNNDNMGVMLDAGGDGGLAHKKYKAPFVRMFRALMPGHTLTVKKKDNQNVFGMRINPDLPPNYALMQKTVEALATYNNQIGTESTWFLANFPKPVTDEPEITPEFLDKKYKSLAKGLNTKGATPEQLVAALERALVKAKLDANVVSF